MTFDAIVLCGGSGARLNGTDKGSVVVGGRSLLDRALDAATNAGTIVVVGPQRPLVRPVVWAVEDPPGGGPAAGIAAGLPFIEAETVLVLAVDYPLVDGEVVRRLVDERGQRAGAILTDAAGRAQFLVGAYDRGALSGAFEGKEPSGMSVRDLLAGLELVSIEGAEAARDCDTWDEVRAAEEILAKGAQ